MYEFGIDKQFWDHQTDFYFNILYVLYWYNNKKFIFTWLYSGFPVLNKINDLAYHDF